MNQKRRLPCGKWRFIFCIVVFSAISISAVHKFYVSVTHLEFSGKDQSFQMTTRIFIDDLETVLNERYEVVANLAEEDEINSASELISRYLKSKISIRINGDSSELHYLGREYRDDVVICYLEIPSGPLEDLQSIEIVNEVLTERFDEQQNVVHLKIGDIKKSFILVRENNKGMLNL